MPKVSVIIPTFNRKTLLVKTLESIFRQSLPPYEIIVVDDHSNDGTLRFLEDTYAQRVVAITNRGKGPGAARNTGLAAASGDYIKFFDSDDVMTSNTLQLQSDVLGKSKKKFVYSPYFFATEENGVWIPTDNVILNYFPFGSKPLWHYMMIDGLFITIPGMLFKKDFLDQVGPWREDVVAYEDWDYLFRMSLLEANPMHTNDCAFLYRVHDSQTTGTHFSDKQRDYDKVVVLKDLYEKRIKNGPGISNYEKAFFLNKFYQIGGVAHGPSETDTLRYRNSFKQNLIWQFLRLRLKLGRMRTHTNWQPCHGPLVSREIVENYITLAVE